MLSRRRSRSPVRFLECRVVLLDNSEFCTTFESGEIEGSELFEQVCAKAQIPPRFRKYFGLQYVDRKDGEMSWVLLESPIRVSKKRGKSRNFQMAVKVFPEDPSKIVEHSLSTSRWVVFQLKYFITQGKLHFPLNQHAVLDSYFAQAVLGDYTTQDHGLGYLEGLLGSRFFAHPSYINSNLEISDSAYEKMVTGLHKSRNGMKTHEALMAFLDLCHASKLYGKFIHKGATDSSNNDVLFVISVKGLQISVPDEFREPGELLHDFPWGVVHTILSDKSKLILTIKPGGFSSGPEIIYSFKFHGHFAYLQADRVVTDCVNHKILALKKATLERKAHMTQSLEDVSRTDHLAVPGPGWRTRSYSPLMSLKKQMRIGAEHYV